MSEVSALQDLREVDIFTKQILGKKVLTDVDTLWQEEYDATNVPTGKKLPFRIYVINNGSTPGATPALGSPVKCAKLVKRLVDPGYPKNSLICNHKSKVTHRYQLVLIVEFENGTFDVITLPKNLSHRLQYNAATTKAFIDATVINAAGTPVLQKQNVTAPFESLIIVSTGANQYSSYEYNVTIPFTDFTPILRPCELEDPSLQSYILLKNFRYDVDVQDTLQISTSDTNSVWTTIVDLTVTEDIINKLGIDQDVIIQGTPEYTC
ncbi:MAG: hypothetical protein N2376_10790 [Clostridia bacterium]|nr:hypothetical protein [Clostridia bacterium]